MDSAQGIRYSVQKTFSELNLPIPTEEQIPIGPPIMTTMLNLIGGNERLAAEVRDRYRQIYAEEGINQFVVYPNIENFLMELHRNDRHLFVATNKTEKFAVKMIENLKWSYLFKRIYGGTLEKPLRKSELIEAALREFNLDRSNTLMIGDHAHDLQAAQESKIGGVGVIWGYGPEGELRANSSIFIANSVNSLKDFLLTKRLAG